MDGKFLIQGMILGFSIAAPVGPIGVLCIRRSLVEGRLAGLLTGLGAATADAIYGAIAGFGLTLVANFLVEQSFWLRLLGGLFLCYLGVKTFLSRSAITHPVAADPIVTDPVVANPIVAHTADRQTANAKTVQTKEMTKAYAAMYASTVFLTLTNPATILSFAAVFAGLGLATAAGNYANAGLLVFGVFTGSALWWLFLSSGVSLLRHRFQNLQFLNRISGLILLVFGIIALSLS